jgi:Family of unknown function (DUF5871)
MEYATPQKLPDGRYFLKISGQRKQLNNVTLQDDLTTKNLNLKIQDDQVDFFKGIDEEILAQAKKSKTDWFGKELSDETIENAYQESITDGLVGASLATVKGEFITLAFDRQRNAIELASVKKDTQCDVVLELSGLWFLKKSFGPIWRVLQVRVRGAPKAPEFAKEYLFEDDPAEEDDPADYLD